LQEEAMPDKTKAVLIDFLVEQFTEDELASLWKRLLPHHPMPDTTKVSKWVLAQHLIENCEASHHLLNLFREIEHLRPGHLRDGRNPELGSIEAHISAHLNTEVPMDMGVSIDPSEYYAREQVRLDAATPSYITVHEPFDMAVAVLQSGSLSLHVEGLPHVSSAEGEVLRSSGNQVVTFRVEVVPNTYFDIRPYGYTLQLTPGTDSRPLFFQLVAKEAGERSLVLNAFQVDRDIVVASTRLLLTVRLHVDESQATDTKLGATHRRMTLTHADTTDAGTNSGLVLAERPAKLMKLELLHQLDQSYSIDELMDVCFALDVDFDNLKGDTKRGKARDLILSLIRRGELQRLITFVSQQRPPITPMM
jgi:hypothetical protein